MPVGARPFGVVARGDAIWAPAQGMGEVLGPAGSGWTRFPLGSDPRALALAPDGALYAPRFGANHDAGRVWRSPGAPMALAPDPGPDSDTNARGIPNLLGAIGVSPDGGRLAVGGLQANLARGAWRDGQPLTFETTARATLRLISLETGEEVASAATGFDDQDAVSALGTWAIGPWRHDGPASTLEEAIHRHRRAELDAESVLPIARFVRSL